MQTSSSLDSCVYCGNLAHVMDHCVPYAYAGRAGNRRGGSDAGFKVPCCDASGVIAGTPAAPACNQVLGSRLDSCIHERYEYLHKRMTKKLRRWVNFKWTREEIEEEGRFTGATMLQMVVDLERKEHAILRLETIAEGPPLEVLKVWHQLIEEVRYNGSCNEQH